MSENGEIYTAGKDFTLPPALTAWTNSTSAGSRRIRKIPGIGWYPMGPTNTTLLSLLLFYEQVSLQNGDTMMVMVEEENG